MAGQWAELSILPFSLYQMDEMRLEGVIYDMVPTPNGGTVIAGEKEGSPWVTHVTIEAGIAWE